MKDGDRAFQQFLSAIQALNDEIRGLRQDLALIHRQETVLVNELSQLNRHLSGTAGLATAAARLFSGGSRP